MALNAIAPWLLPAMMLLPFAGGVLAWWTERLGTAWPRWVSLASLGGSLAIALLLWAIAPAVPAGTEPQWMWTFRLPWIPQLGISFHLGLDGLALVLVVLTGVLGLLAVLCSWREIQRHVGFFHLNLLWNLAGVIGVFLALDLFLFFLLWEAMLVPMYFLIALWGHSGGTGLGRIGAATKFFIYTQASGLVMLVAILALVYLHHQSSGVLSFDYLDLLSAEIAPQAEYLLMLGFFVAFAVKLPVVPVHAWLPDAHSQAPTAGSVDLAGVLLKTGAYGLIRFSATLFPEATLQFADVAMALGVIGVIYGALAAIRQTDIKRFVAYTSIAHMGFVVLGIYSGSEAALTGAVIQMLAHGLSTGALFVLCGELYERVHTRELARMGGLADRMPIFASYLLFYCIASLGMPGTGNFLGEFLVLLGTWPVAPAVAVLAAFGVVAAAVYALLLVQRSIHGKAVDGTPLADLNAREQAMMLVTAVLLIALGVYPQPVIDLVQGPVAHMVLVLQGAAP